MQSIRYFCQILTKLKFFKKNRKIPIYETSLKTVQWSQSCSVGKDGRTGRHNEVNSRFSQFYERVLNVIKYSF